MSDYIERNALLDDIRTAEKIAFGILETKLVKEIIEEQPTADVVEVVRCKDCKHGELGINPNDDTECVYCDPLDEVWEVDDFCVMGERREDDEE